MKDTSALEVACPDFDEQTAIATILSDMDTELAALEARRDKTCALIQDMMQKLRTGRYVWCRCMVCRTPALRLCFTNFTINRNLLYV
jgi:hypothetical protein